MILGDYHTHTTFSRMKHGKGTIEENVEAALSLGLKEIGITDHGSRHLTYALKRKKLKKFMAEISAAREKFKDIKIYAGMECNILSSRGDIDLYDEFNDALDIVVCGYHKLVKPFKIGDIGDFLLPNFFSKNKVKTMVRNTDAYLKAIERYRIDIISHPNTDCRIDLKAVGEQAVKYGTYLELNGKHVDITSEQLCILADMGVKFVMDSDAHSPKRVGDVEKQIEAVKAAGLSFDIVDNWDKLPTFRSQKERKVADKTDIAESGRENI